MGLGLIFDLIREVIAPLSSAISQIYAQPRALFWWIVGLPGRVAPPESPERPAPRRAGRREAFVDLVEALRRIAAELNPRPALRFFFDAGEAPAVAIAGQADPGELRTPTPGTPRHRVVFARALSSRARSRRRAGALRPGTARRPLAGWA